MCYYVQRWQVFDIVIGRPLMTVLPGISLATTDGAAAEVLAICWWLIM